MRNISVSAVVISFAVSAVLGPVVIPFLRNLKCGQDGALSQKQTAVEICRLRRHV